MPFTTRLAEADDYSTFARLFPELQIHDPLPDAERFVRQMLPRVLLLEEDGAAIAYASWQLYGQTAHIVHVVVDSRCRGRGAGQVLMTALRETFLREGCTRMYLNVKRDNAPALRLYDRNGLRIDHTTWVMRIEWSRIDLLVENHTAEAGRIEPADDAEIAACFELPRERLAILRARPGVQLIGLREAARWVAFAAFDPAFPIAYPLRVARIDLLRPLLAACHEQADRGRFDFVRLPVERDAALKDMLAQAGAEVSFEILQLGAPLP